MLLVLLEYIVLPVGTQQDEYSSKLQFKNFLLDY